jgi:hypothetical protein
MRLPVGNSQSVVRMQRTTGWIQFSFNPTTRNILGGITRMRFKGFDRRFAPIMSAMRLPHIKSQSESGQADEVNDRYARSQWQADRPPQRFHGIMGADSRDDLCVGLAAC